MGEYGSCEFCSGTFSADEADPWCCADQEAEFAKFMVLVDAKRDEMFWSMIGGMA
jgi:hypothetical protein